MEQQSLQVSWCSNCYENLTERRRHVCYNELFFQYSPYKVYVASVALSSIYIILIYYNMKQKFIFYRNVRRCRKRLTPCKTVLSTYGPPLFSPGILVSSLAYWTCWGIRRIHFMGLLTLYGTS